MQHCLNEQEAVSKHSKTYTLPTSFSFLCQFSFVTYHNPLRCFPFGYVLAIFTLKLYFRTNETVQGKKFILQKIPVYDGSSVGDSGSGTGSIIGSCSDGGGSMSRSKVRGPVVIMDEVFVIL